MKNKGRVMTKDTEDVALREKILHEVKDAAAIGESKTLKLVTYGIYAKSIERRVTNIENLIKQEANRQKAELLDRLIAQQWRYGKDDDALAVPTRYLVAEREKLEQVRKEFNE